MAGSIYDLDETAFGEVAESVIVRGYYDTVRHEVTERIFAAGEVLGRTTIIRVTHDGEIGAQIAVFPRHPREVFDPLSQGV